MKQPCVLLLVKKITYQTFGYRKVPNMIVCCVLTVFSSCQNIFNRPTFGSYSEVRHLGIIRRGNQGITSLNKSNSSFRIDAFGIDWSVSCIPTKWVRDSSSPNVCKTWLFKDFCSDNGTWCAMHGTIVFCCSWYASSKDECNSERSDEALERNCLTWLYDSSFPVSFFDEISLIVMEQIWSTCCFFVFVGRVIFTRKKISSFNWHQSNDKINNK